MGAIVPGATSAHPRALGWRRFVIDRTLDRRQTCTCSRMANAWCVQCRDRQAAARAPDLQLARATPMPLRRGAMLQIAEAIAMRRRDVRCSQNAGRIRERGGRTHGSPQPCTCDACSRSQWDYNVRAAVSAMVLHDSELAYTRVVRPHTPAASPSILKRSDSAERASRRAVRPDWNMKHAPAGRNDTKPRQ